MKLTKKRRELAIRALGTNSNAVLEAFKTIACSSTTRPLSEQDRLYYTCEFLHSMFDSWAGSYPRYEEGTKRFFLPHFEIEWFGSSLCLAAYQWNIEIVDGRPVKVRSSNSKEISNKGLTLFAAFQLLNEEYQALTLKETSNEKEPT